MTRISPRRAIRRRKLPVLDEKMWGTTSVSASGDLCKKHRQMIEWRLVSDDKDKPKKGNKKKEITCFR